MLQKISVIVLAVLLAGCATDGGSDATAPVATPQSHCPEPAPAPVCPKPAPLPELPVCPEPVQCPPVPACPAPVPAPGKVDGKLILGAVEVVAVQPGNMQLEARVDTGATTTSLHATDVVVFERDGERWVRFDADTGAGKAPVQLELPWVRRARIKGEGEEIDKRPVVMIEVSIGDLQKRIEVTLNDRSNYEYPLLIGRNFLSDAAIVDVARSYVFGK